ncbi:MAG: 4,5-DOPA dioxygenase extradiol [Rhodoferax sp.]|jgi:4,5-DOPA dioxygenase extradiol|uniref:4,5-DOPA-extradiol-dioxygenase n=1 Tax=Rhodoferax sp. TaxID=50421 RepID=UPI001B53738F|nr:4,5-DOPA dioxygenase extradiol [Rhodoferax sp.]MBP9148863.1 4,5-DOPA dioxygenase extradiol [Rhodoferax sp.]MBP9737018.1 4,5-DOPA dioxygenase extradiol [Rhodoferax sp.]
MLNPKFLQPSARLPALFVAHGSPMNVLPGNRWHDRWQALGAQFGSRWPVPRLIVCISAHWLTDGWWLTAMAQPKTIHDFGGFPSNLFAQQYPAPGWPDAARELATMLIQPGSNEPLQLDDHEWGLDHGTWGVLKPMFPLADIPVIQLSMDYHRPVIEHFALGQQLRALRDLGVLIVASGNIVHNLRSMQREAADDQAYDWAHEFDQTIADFLENSNMQALQDFQQLPTARLAHPSYDHLLPLLYAAGAAWPEEQSEFFNLGFQAASISMRSVIWG